jgi:hypothetical protein
VRYDPAVSLAGGAIAWAFSVLFAPPPDAVARDAARGALDSGYQQTLPGEGGAEDGTARGRPERWRPRRGTPREPERRFDVGGGDGGAVLGRLLLWAALFACAVVVAVLLARAWAGRTRGYREEPAAARGPPKKPLAASPLAPAAVAVPPRTPAEDLARAGRFAEAVHALLLDALGALGAAAGASRLSLTSREVLAGAETVVAPVARAGLADLVLAVERSRFAERPTDEAEWAAAREAHGRFRAGRAESTGAPPRGGAA